LWARIANPRYREEVLKKIETYLGGDTTRKETETKKKKS
jgi:hypothetical protein